MVCKNLDTIPKACYNESAKGRLGFLFAPRGQQSCRPQTPLARVGKHRAAGLYVGAMRKIPKRNPQTPETKAKIAAAARQQWAERTAEQRQELSDKISGTLKEYYADDDIRQQLSERQKAAWQDNDLRERQSESHKQFYATEEGQKQRQIKAELAHNQFAGKPFSREHRAKISESFAKLFQTGFSPWSYTKRGHYTSTKTGETMWYRSSYELRAMEILDTLPQVVSFRAEAVRVPYEFEGGVHNYLPDLEVNLVGGRTVYIEVKPATRELTAKEQAKMAAGEAAFGCDFLVCSEILLSTEAIGSILNA